MCRDGCAGIIGCGGEVGEGMGLGGEKARHQNVADGAVLGGAEQIAGRLAVILDS